MILIFGPNANGSNTPYKDGEAAQWICSPRDAILISDRAYAAALALPSWSLLSQVRNKRCFKEGTVEAITLLLGVTLRIILPIGVLFWISAKLQAWDQKGGEVC